MKKQLSIWILGMGCGLAMTALATAPDFALDDVEQWVATASRYEIGASHEAFARIERIIRDTQPGQPLRQKLEQKIVAALQSDATAEAKRCFCRTLWIIGTDASVAVLEPLLASEDSCHMGCYALLNHPGKMADAALMRSLDKMPGPSKLNLINTLAERRYEPATSRLKKLAQETDPEIAQAAIAALGRIGKSTAASALEKINSSAPEHLRLAICLAQIQCAQHLAQAGSKDQAFRILKRLHARPVSPRVARAALVTLVDLGFPDSTSLVLASLKQEDPGLRAAAIAQVSRLNDPAATWRFAECLASAADSDQVLLVEALVKRNDPSARAAIAMLLESPNPEVVMAAMRATGRWGDSSSVAPLIRTAARFGSRNVLATVCTSLRLLRGDAVDYEIVRELDGTQAELRARLLEVLAQRESRMAFPVLVAETANADDQISLAAFRALGQLATPGQLMTVTRCLTTQARRQIAGEAEQAILPAFQRIPEAADQVEPVLKVYAATPKTAPRQVLLRLMGTLGGAKALETVLTATLNRDAMVRETALRSLANWPDAAAVMPILDKIRAVKDPTLDILLVRGALRLLPSATDLPASEKIKAYAGLIAQAPGTGEKKLVLSGLGESAIPGSMQLVVPFLEDSEVQAEAGLAALKIAKASRPIAGDVQAALKKVAATTKDEKLKQEALDLLPK